MVIGLAALLVFGLVGALVGWLAGRLGLGLSIGLVLGLDVGLGIGLNRGLGAFVQHFALRFFLWRAGRLPWRYARFLDDAAERILLRKVGGGYIFVHRLLQDYFASVDAKSAAPSGTEHPFG